MQAKILVPDMVKRGFSSAYSSVITAASSLVTPIIPPGIGMIMYAFIANVSVGRMFLAGIVPGVLMCLFQMVTNYFISKSRGYSPIRQKRASINEVIREGKSALLAILFPVIIIGGIRLGIFTPTEAGAIAVFYALVLGVLLYKEMKFKDAAKALADTAMTACTCLMIFASANVFAWFVTNEKISDNIANFILNYVSTPTMFLLVFMIAVLILGMFLDGATLMIILVPLLLPVVKEMGIDPVHFGIIYLLTSAIGNITPPVGLVMYTVCDITKVKIIDFARECLPYYMVLIINLLILALIPGIVIFLPNLFFGT
ncbi:MAG: TRAP transporter large permease [Firmicutes bacterium]|nr:TRAP transporter large permease [Bacillota bacterium]